MKYILIFLSVFILGCDSTEQYSDEDLSQKILGTWTHNYYEGSYGIIEYLPSGDKCEIGLNFDFSGTPELDFYWNKWEIQNGIIKTTLHATNTILEKGRQINDEIVLLNDHELTVNMVVPKGEDTEYHHRSKHSLSGKVCEIVKKHLTRN